MRACSMFATLLMSVTVATIAATASAAPTAGRADDEPFGHEAYARVLAAYVDERGFVDYAALKRGRRDLDRYTAQLGAIEPGAFAAWSEKRKIAVLVNAYNAFTLRASIDHYPIQSSFFKSLRFPSNSIRQIDGVWTELRFRLAGRSVTLEQIEHEMLRRWFDEPRIHMAINCASVGCPPLRREPYTAERLDAQLDDQARRFLADPRKFRIDRESGRVYLSPIFDWFGEDFAGRHTPAGGFEGHKPGVRAALHFISGHIGDGEARYLRAGRYGVRWLDYDWSLNEHTPAAGATPVRAAD